VNFDPWQREVLEALGHTVYRLAPAESSVAAQVQKSAPVEDALLRALLRAAARDVVTEDAVAVLHASPLASLRGNPAAKRALWPRLRALRARGATS
jgi:DNA polymerase III psi subunit